MRVTIMALGSYGDVFPFALLGGALRRAGHAVLLTTFESFGALAEAHGLALHPVAGDPAAVLQTGGGLALAEAGQSIPRMLRSVRKSFGALADAYGQAFGDPVLRETDLVVSQLPGDLYARDVAGHAGVPLVHASVIPMTPTRSFPMPAFPQALARLPGYNRLSYRLAGELVWQLFRRAVSRWRRDALQLPPAPLLGHLELPGVPVLNAFSRHVVPRPADWPAHVHVTGYWFPEDEEWDPPEDLLRFLDAGPPPVFVGFGSMPVRDPQATTALVLEAVRRSGARAILHAGWAGLASADLAPNVYPLNYAPYSWLFPRMAAVIHHGGSGTTAAGLRAGVPGLVIPFVFDQFFWGQRLHALGVGPAPLPFKQLTAAKLAAAVQILTGSPSMQTTAAALAAHIRAEPGLDKAVRIIEAIRADS